MKCEKFSLLHWTIEPQYQYKATLFGTHSGMYKPQSIYNQDGQVNWNSNWSSKGYIWTSEYTVETILIFWDVHTQPSEFRESGQ